MPEYVISKDLQKHITAIKKYTESVKKGVFEISWRLAEIADPQSGLLDGSGYANIVEFAADQFGYSKSATYNYIAIANKYLVANNKEIRTICARIDDGGTTVEDYKVGQLNALGKVTRDEFRELDTNGIINPNMSADKIKAAVKNYFNPPEPEPTPEPDTADTGTESEQNPCITLSIIQIFLNIVTPCINYGDAIKDEGAERAVDIFNEFFHGEYKINWIQIDGEIKGAQLIDFANTKNGGVIFTTNSQEV